MATKLSPSPRPNLPRLDVGQYPKEPPITVPNDDSEAAVLSWCEEMRDHYEKEAKKKLSVKGLKHMARVAGLDPTQTAALLKTINTLYADELKAGDAKPVKTVAKPAKDKPAVKAKNKKVIAEAKATAKTNGKPTKTNGKPASKTAKTKKPKSDKPKRTQVEAVSIYDKSVKGIHVQIFKTETGKFRVLFDEVPMRGVMRFLGAQGWITEEVENACVKLLANTKGLSIMQKGKRVNSHEAYVHEIVGGGHVGAGAKAGLKGKKSCFGKTPEVGADLLKKLKAIRH